MTTPNTTELFNRLELEPCGPAYRYFKLEYLIAYAIEFTESLRKDDTQRAPVDVEYKALVDAAERLTQAISMMRELQR